MAERVRSDAQLLSHLNGTATTIASGALTVPAKTNYILISNTDSTNKLLVSFDGAVNFLTIQPLASLSLDVDNFSNRNTNLQVKSSASTVAYEVLFGSEI